MLDAELYVAAATEKSSLSALGSFNRFLFTVEWPFVVFLLCVDCLVVFVAERDVKHYVVLVRFHGYFFLVCLNYFVMLCWILEGSVTIVYIDTPRAITDCILRCYCVL